MRDCCLFIRCGTTPPKPVTGCAHPKCFARDLKDCGDSISREHYISRSLLGVFGGREIAVSGMPWIPDGQQRVVSSASLTSKMLCERHNHALSPLDTVASEFFRFFVATWSEEELDLFLCRGYDLERWLLKMLCGLVVSGNATFSGKALPTWTPPLEWLEILFGSTDVESPAGLHYVVAPNYRAESAVLHVTPVFKSTTAHPIAMAFSVEGIVFLFAMEELPPLAMPSATGADTRYRPKALQLDRTGQIREAHFGWPDGQLVKLHVSKL